MYIHNTHEEYQNESQYIHLVLHLDCEYTSEIGMKFKKNQNFHVNENAYTNFVSFFFVHV